MAYLESAYTDIRTVIASVWTDVLTNGIWEGEHIEMIPWEKITPPTGAICIADTPLSPNWGACNQIYNPTVEIYYVGAITGGSAPIRAKLEGLRDALLANTVPSGLCVLDVIGLSWSDLLEANKALTAKNYPYRAGRLQASILAGTRG